MFGAYHLAGKAHTVRSVTPSLAFHSRGNGPLIILVHGLLMNGDSWQRKKRVTGATVYHRCNALKYPFAGRCWNLLRVRPPDPAKAEDNRQQRRCSRQPQPQPNGVFLLRYRSRLRRQ